jgi:hypothetical protein
MSVQNQVPNFVPSVNGWNFPNSDKMPGSYGVITLPAIGTIATNAAGKGICGGFTFSVRDMFEHRPRLLPSPSTDLPAAHSPDWNLLTSRFLDSISVAAYANAAKAIAWIQTPDHDVVIGGPGLAHQMIETEWPALKTAIDAGNLVPLYLIVPPQCGILDVVGISAALRRSHQVLAYRYQLDDADNLTIWVYDPDAPGYHDPDDITISLNIANPAHTTEISAPLLLDDMKEPKIRGFFCAQYQYQDPTPTGADLRIANSAQFIGQDLPTPLAAGQTATIVMRNTGALTWTPQGGDRLGSQSPQDNELWGTNRINLSGAVAPGEQAMFSLTIPSLPEAGGTFRWQMVQDGVEWFGATTPPVTVPPGPCAALAAELTGAQFQVSSLQDQLRHAAGPDKPELVQEIKQAEAVVASLEKRKAALGCP